MRLVPSQPILDASSALSSEPRALLRRIATRLLCAGAFLTLIGVLSLPATPGLASYGEGLEAYLQGDYDKAREVWLAEAANGDARAQLGLGILYESGRGVATSGTEAADWYRKAADQGEATAQYNLGRLYATGTGVARDLTQAARLWLRAADQGNPGAMHNLGVMYYRGEGVGQDFTIAADWFRKSARSNFAESEYMLGEMLRLGQGEEQDLQQATEWLVRAGTQGHEPARLRLQALIEEGLIDSGAVPPEAMGRRAVAATQPVVGSQPGSASQAGAPTVPNTGTAAATTAAGQTAGEQGAVTAATDGQTSLAAATSAGQAPTGYQLWIASFRDPGQAEFQWQNLQDTYPDLFAGLQSEVSPSSMGEGRGVFYRLLAGPVETPIQGQTICEALLRRAPGSFCRLLDPAEAQ